MKNTTLCYLEHGGCYLMLHRTKKEQDENAGKWVGVGGKLEPGESPDACLVREVKEETGFTLHGWRFRGVVSFLSDIYEAEQMFLFTSEDFSGVLLQIVCVLHRGFTVFQRAARIAAHGVGFAGGLFYNGTHGGASDILLFVFHGERALLSA